eukprot:511505_1
MSDYRFRLKTVLYFLFTWILLGVIYIQYNGIYLWGYNQFTTNKPNTTQLTLSSLSTQQTLQCWHTIFESNIINQTIKIQPTQYPILTPCIDEITKMQLFSLLSTTDLILRHITKSHNITKYITYRDTIILRRIISIIFHQKQFHSHNAYRRFLDTINKLTKSTHFLPTHLHKTYYNIHVSKSGGNSICATFNNLPFSTIKTPDKSVCNARYKSGSDTCEQQYQYAETFDMIARENAMDVFYDNKSNTYHPKLCDNFIYLLPFRHPFEKAFSWVQSENLLDFEARNQFYKRVDNQQDKLKHFNNVPCMNKPIMINGIKYKRIITGHGFQGFFVDMLNSENDTELLVSSHKDFALLANIFGNKSDKLDIKWDKCYNKHKNVNEWVYEFLNKDNKFGSKFMVRRSRNRYNFAGLRLGRSSVANTFTSWLGYGDKYRWIYSAQMNPRYTINTEHYMNAVWLLMGIDHVLPFWRFYNSDAIYGDNVRFGMSSLIWNVTYLSILNHFEHKFKKDSNETRIENGKPLKYWGYVGHNERSSRHIKADNVAKGVSEQDINALRKHNAYDIELFKLAQWVAKVDVEYMTLFI